MADQNVGWFEVLIDEVGILSIEIELAMHLDPDGEYLAHHLEEVKLKMLSPRAITHDLFKGFSLDAFHDEEGFALEDILRQ